MSDDHITLPDDEPERPDGEEPTVEPDGAEPPEPVIPTCTECGNELEPGQPYCLECGAPTPDAPKLRRKIGPAGILAIGLIALGVGAGALAYAIAKDDDTAAVTTSTVSTIPTDTGLPTFPTGTVGTEPTSSVDVTDTQSTFPTFPTTSTFPTFPTTPTDVTTLTTPTFTSPTTTPTFTTPTTTPTTPSSGADTWPDGTSGWTVILASTTSQSDATAFRDQVRGTGRSAGLIDSSLYATLEPGYWVVWTGVYSSRTEAINQAEILRATYPGAYAQRIEEA
jgi:hypothetical protein